MTKKTGLQKSSRSEPPENGKPSYHITGSIHAGRDVIIGDQINYINQQIAKIKTPAEFVDELQRLHALIADVKRQPGLDAADVQTVEIVESRVKDAVEEAKKPKPNGAAITTTLEKAKKTMELLTGSIAAAVGLGVAIAGLIQVVGGLF